MSRLKDYKVGDTFAGDGRAHVPPDVIAVLDMEPQEPESWIVSNESGFAGDLALEIIMSGKRRKI